MPGTTPAASQLDWLISSTTTMVLFCSKAIRERLRSSTWVMGASPSIFAQRKRCQTFAAVPIASGPRADISGRRRNVLVYAEKVGRIVLLLQCAQTSVVVAIGRFDTRLAFVVHHEVRIGAFEVKGMDGCPIIPRPLLQF